MNYFDSLPGYNIWVPTFVGNKFRKDIFGIINFNVYQPLFAFQVVIFPKKCWCRKFRRKN